MKARLLTLVVLLTFSAAGCGGKKGASTEGPTLVFGRGGDSVRLIHTGQHFDAAMSDVFFRDLGLPSPDVSLNAGGGSHAEQTAAVLVGIGRIGVRDLLGPLVHKRPL